MSGGKTGGLAAFIERREAPITVAAALVCLALFAVLYACQVWDLIAWRTDSLFMLDSYRSRLTGEGRWFNYLIFPWLRQTNMHLAVAVCLASWAFFSLRVAQRYGADRPAALLFVALSLQIPAFYSVIGWSATVMPTFLMLALFAALAGRIPLPVFFLAGGVCFFGGLNNYYNLLILLVLPELAGASFKRVLRILILWAAGFVFGYLVMLVMVRILGGQWGLTIAPWRHAHIAASLPELATNLTKTLRDMADHLILIGYVPLALSLVLSAGFCAADATRPRTARSVRLWPLAAALAAAFATYIQAAPYGLFVEPRTPYGLFGAAFVLVLMILVRWRIAGCVLAILMASCMFMKNYESLHFVNAITHTWCEAYKRIPLDPKTVRLVHICSPDSEIGKVHAKLVDRMHLKPWHNEGYHENDRQAAIMYAAGYHGDFEWWFPNKCAAISDNDKQQTDAFLWTYRNWELYVWQRPDFP